MSFARTLRGDVDPSTLGVVNGHDHLIRTGAGEVYIDADHLLDDVDKAVEEATYFVDASKKWSVDGGRSSRCARRTVAGMWICWRR